MTFLVSRSFRASFLLLAGFVALVALACGSDDSPSEPAAATETPAAAATAATATEVATEPPTEAATEAATEPPPATEAADEGGSVDENYLRAFCVGGNDLQAAMFTAAIRLEAEGGDPDDPEVFAELFVAPLAGFLEHMRETTPPDDLAEYHAAALAQYEALVTLFTAIGEGGEELEGDPFELLGGMLAGAEQFPVVPQAALARLFEVAEGVPECAGSLFLGEFLRAGSAGEPVDTGAGATGEVDIVAEEYVRELCLAGDNYEATIQEATAGLDPDANIDESDPEVFAALFTEALRGLAADMGAMSPPDSVVEYHAAGTVRFEEMVGILDGIIAALDAGEEVAAEDLARFQQLLQGGVGLPGLPFNEANRLATAANNVIECYNSGFLFGLLSASQ